MSRVNFLEKLLDGVAVEWKQLGELEDEGFVKLGRGNVISKKDLASTPGDFPVYSSSAIGIGEFGRYGKYMFDDERITWSVDGGGRFFFRSAHKYSVTNVCGWMTVLKQDRLNTRFLYHVLSGAWERKVFDYIKKAHPSVIRDEYEIPIPCPDNPKKSLEIQAEIVRILDAMTAHTAELTAELTARKKQYNYYRDKLLSFEDGEVEWKELGEEFPFIRNGFVGTVTPFFTTRDKGVRYLQGTNINNGNIRDNVEYYVNLDFHEKHLRTHLKADDILLVQSGHVGDSAVVGEKYKGSNCHALIVISNAGRMNSKFVNYYFQSRQGKEQLRKITTGGTVKHILASKMKKFMIPVPSIEVQNQIVDLLDKFNALTTSITEGLPREIELRQKQYAYYRDLLLSFPQAQAA